MHDYHLRDPGGRVRRDCKGAQGDTAMVKELAGQVREKAGRSRERVDRRRLRAWVEASPVCNITCKIGPKVQHSARTYSYCKRMVC